MIVPLRKLAAPAALAALLLVGCGGPGDGSDLAAYLHKQHQYAHDFDALNGATYTVDGNDVTIRTTLYTQATAAQDVCNWASEWLYDNADDGSIRVLNRDGDVLSQRHAQNDVCSFG